MVEYHPISARDKSRLHQFWKKVFPGIFFEYALIAERIWKGEILVADVEVLENIDASEIHPRRINANVSFQVSVCTWLLCQSELVYRKHVCLKTLSVVCRLSVVTSWSCLATHGRPAYGPPCTVGVLPWTHGVVTKSRITRKQRANPCVCWLEW